MCAISSKPKCKHTKKPARKLPFQLQNVGSFNPSSWKPHSEEAFVALCQQRGCTWKSRRGDDASWASLLKLVEQPLKKAQQPIASYSRITLANWNANKTDILVTKFTFSVIKPSSKHPFPWRSFGICNSRRFGTSTWRLRFSDASDILRILTFFDGLQNNDYILKAMIVPCAFRTRSWRILKILFNKFPWKTHSKVKHF